MKDNSTPHRSEEYDDKVKRTIPYYECFHDETVKLVKAVMGNPDNWLDTGCGTGFLIEKAAEVFPRCSFTLCDPSPEMLDKARKRLIEYDNISYMNPSGTESIDDKIKNVYDVITAIQSHHYVNRSKRKKAVKKSYNLLKKCGIFITFENIRPEHNEATDFQLDKWMSFQLAKGKSQEEVKEHRKRFDRNYFPIKISEHVKLYKSVGFKIVETFWVSYMQAGFFCIK